MLIINFHKYKPALPPNYQIKIIKNKKGSIDSYTLLNSHIVVAPKIVVSDRFIDLNFYQVATAQTCYGKVKPREIEGSRVAYETGYSSVPTL